MRRLLSPIILVLLLLTVVPSFVLAQKPAPSGFMMTSGAHSLTASIPLEARLKIAPELLKEATSRVAPKAEDTSTQTVKPEPLTYLVFLKARAPLGDLANIPTLDARRIELVARLQSTALRSQAPLVTYLHRQLKQGKITGYKSYWIFNGLAVTGDVETLIELAKRPQVEYIRPNRLHRLPPPERGAQLADVGSNIVQIGADRVWQEFGITGKDIVVANMDSGVDWTHPALIGQYRGYNPTSPANSVHDYNWFDATGTYPNAPGPNRGHITSQSDHGTHTMGTLVGVEADGANQIGVAPGARWIAAKVFDDEGNAYDTWIHDGFQWCLAPTDLRGQNPDPTKAPHIVSNSWGDSNSLDDSFVQDVQAWRAAGIFSTWAAGNDGPDTGTISSPASYPGVLAIGAVDSGDRIAGFSSRGPGVAGTLKPDLVAPGVGIRSSIAGGGYEGTWNGTSMATPHVAGVVALMWDALDHSHIHPVSITETERILIATAVDLGAPGPDMTYGHGRVDAYEAVRAVYLHGCITGQVRDALVGSPITGALVTIVDTETGEERTMETDAAGVYRAVVPEGLYTVSVVKFGFRSRTMTEIDVLNGICTQLDHDLIPLAMGVIRGRIISEADGKPLSARIMLVGTLGQAETDQAGYYEIAAPADRYTLRVIPTEPGHRGAKVSDVMVQAGQTTVIDLALSPIPRILLVNAEAGTAGGVVAYQTAALDTLLYSYDLWEVYDPPTDLPSAAQLMGYDVIIWAQPALSPGFVGAWEALAEYLDSGGRLLLNGQNVGYWDDGEGLAAAEYRRYLGASYIGDNGGQAPIAGVADGILDGLSLLPNTGDSARNHISPDIISAGGLGSQAICLYAPGQTAGVQVDACTYRAVYFAFGLESIGPLAVRAEVLRRTINWLAATNDSSTVQVALEAPAKAGIAGSELSYGLTILNSTISAERYSITVNGERWLAKVIDARTQTVITETAPLEPCERLDMTLRVLIPPDAANGQQEQTEVRIVSQSAPGRVATATATTTAIQPWETAPPLPLARYRLAAAAIGCRIYALGGFDENDIPLALLDIFDPAEGSWLQGTPRPIAAGNSAVAVVDGRLYALGGYIPGDPGIFLSDVHSYDPYGDAWTGEEPLPVPLSGAAAASVGGDIYVFGGNTSDGSSTATFVFRPRKHRWQRLASAPVEALSFAQAVALNGKIYVAGGWPNENHLLEYDPATDSWSKKRSMPLGRHSFAMVTDGHFLYVAGGGDTWDGLSSVVRYDPQNDTWLELPPLFDGNRAGTAGAYLDGFFYVIGGSGDSTSASVEVVDLGAPLAGSYLAIDPTLARPGEQLAFSLRVRNPSDHIVLANWQHDMPDALEYVVGSATSGVNYDAVQRLLTWSGALSAGDEVSFSWQSTIRSNVPSGSIIPAGVLLDGGGCVARRLQQIAKVYAPTVTLSKSVDKSSARPGEELHYRIRVENASPFDIGDVSVVDALPEYASIALDSIVGATYDPNTRQVEWRGSLPAGMDSGTAFTWLDATSGRALGLQDDTASEALPLGFDFTFYDKTYSRIWVNSNGLVLFEGPDTSYSNVSIPNPASPNAFIAPFWDDLRPGVNGGEVYYAVLGAAPQRVAVVEWHDVRIYGDDKPQKFEVLLYEEGNRIVCQYLRILGNRGRGSAATVGIESPDGREGVQYLYDGQPSEHALEDGLAIEFVHPGTVKPSAHTITFDATIDDAVPPLTVITNTVIAEDGWTISSRQVTTTVQSPRFETSLLTASPVRPLSDEIVTYTFHITNSGVLSAVDLLLENPLPAELSYIADSLQGEGAAYDPVGKRIVWHGQMPPMNHVVLSYKARVQGGLAANSWITNSATLRERGVLVARLQTVVLANEVNLSTSNKSTVNTAYAVDVLIPYTIVVRNSGRYAAARVTLSDTLPSELALEPATLAGAIYAPDERRIAWQGSLAAGQTHTISYEVRLLPNVADGTLVTNTAILYDGVGHVYTLSRGIAAQRGNLSSSYLTPTSAEVIPGRTFACTVRVVNRGARAISGTLTIHPQSPLYLLPEHTVATAGSVSSDGTGLSWRGNVESNTMVLIRCAVKVPIAAAPQETYILASLEDQGGLRYDWKVPVAIGPAKLTFFAEMHAGRAIGP